MIPTSSEPSLNQPLFCDSFLDFDIIKEWFEDSPNPGMDSSEEVNVGAVDKETVKGNGDCGEKSHLELVPTTFILGSNRTGDESNPCDGGNDDPLVNGSVPNVADAKVEELGVSFRHSIEEKMMKVNLDCHLGNLVTAEGNKVDSKIESDGVESGSSSESETGSGTESESGSCSESESERSPLSSSKSDDDEGEEEEGKEERGRKSEEMKETNVVEDAEEGEIRENGKEMSDVSESEDEDDEDTDEDADKMVSWSDIEDEDGANVGAIGKPITSRNELKDLPPVPPVDVTLQPHHQLSTVGVVMSILGAQVVVEGVERHNPLNEGSVLWITETRSPLGLVDEIFGPVKNPYYIVRYNSEDEVPAGIRQGTFISFVAEFANHVLNDKNIYKKGYDASGENDEEVSDEAEFSDDEKEAEYKRRQKMSKRGMNDQTHGNKKNRKKKVRENMSWKNSRPSARQTPSTVGELPHSDNQHHTSPVALSSNDSSCPSSSALGQALIGGGMIPSFPHAAQTTSLIRPPYGVSTNMMPSQQTQTAAFPNGFPTGGNPWLPQQHVPHLYQMPAPNAFSFLQPYNPNCGPLHNVPLPSGSSNFFPATGMHTSWPGVLCPNGFNQTYGMSMQAQQSLHSVSAGNPAMLSSGMRQPPISTGNIEASPNFNIGSSVDYNRRKPHGRGARFAGRRGPRPSS